MEGGPHPYIPTRYNFLTGEQMIETQVQEREEIMRKARWAASEVDDEYKEAMDIAKKKVIRGDFAFAYLLFWKLYDVAPYIFDLPLCMEQCLGKLWPTGAKDILEAATFCVNYLPDNSFSSMYRQILFEFSQTVSEIK